MFVDGDFWQGYRFPLWEGTLSSFWWRKIAGTRVCDPKNFRKLRRMGWTVVRVWQHASCIDLDAIVGRVAAAVAGRAGDPPLRRHAITRRLG